ncbi:MAG: hypothetical protein JNK46_03385 [Methylobacteriaceae bacterium]|nr:hypothetical protein [Methylobacteriaceae bacterium]
MTDVQRRPSELDLNAYVDGRLDADRARQVESEAAADPAALERLQGWLRGRDQLRQAYDPVALETPPLFLSVAARTAARAAEPVGPAARARAARAEVRRFPYGVVAASFLAGAAATVLGAAIFAHLADPARPSIGAGVVRALTLLARGLGFAAP